MPVDIPAKMHVVIGQESPDADVTIAINLSDYTKEDK